MNTRMTGDHTDPDDTPAGACVALQVEVDAAMPLTWLLENRGQWERKAAA